MLTKAQVKGLKPGFTPVFRSKGRKARRRAIKEIKMKGPVAFLRFIKRIAH